MFNCDLQWARVVFTIQPTEQTQLAENMIALVENDGILVVVMAYWASAASSLDLFLGWSGPE